MASQPISFAIDPHAIGLIWDSLEKRPLGTGFVFLRPDWIVTAKHVVFDRWDNPRQVVFGTKGKGFKPAAFIRHPTLDLAVIELATDSPCKTPLYPSYVGFEGKAGLVSVGYRPSLTASSFAEPPTIQVNHIDSFTRQNRERVSGVEETILFNAEFVESGSSGGPIFSASGGVIGVIIQGPATPVATDAAAHATSIVPLLDGLVLTDVWRIVC